MCGVSAQGYICTGNATPDVSLNCSTGSAGNDGSMEYCCTGGPTETTDAGDNADANSNPGICTPITITACTGGSMGYTCTGSNPPSVANPGLNCGNGTQSGTTTEYCCLPPAGDAGVEGGSSCKVGVSSGNAACDTCIDNSCCTPLTTCDTPDDAGTDSSGLTACERLVTCLLDCMAGNPDAGVDAGSAADCQSLCNPSYSASEQSSAQAVMTCEMSSCATACQ